MSLEAGSPVTTNNESGYGREVFYGVITLLFVGSIAFGVVVWKYQQRFAAPWAQAPVTPVARAEELSVVRHLEVDGAPYLLWSNGQVTPDMAAHRKFILRTLAAQAMLESQASGR
jgi:hypothetical protein